MTGPEAGLDTKVDEIADGVYRFSTWMTSLNLTTLVIMHGASYSGDGAAQLRAL
jgi:hypothetical protein